MRPVYFDRYPTIHFERDAQGILLMRLHTNGGPVVYASQNHSDWCAAFYEVGADRDNQVVILTGTGDAFINRFGWDKPNSGPADWDVIYWEGRRMLRNLLDIEVPVIGAVNGPATIHAELALLSDITLAASTATFQDQPHIPFRTVPGDGVHEAQHLVGRRRQVGVEVADDRRAPRERLPQPQAYGLRLPHVPLERQDVDLPGRLLPEGRQHSGRAVGRPIVHEQQVGPSRARERPERPGIDPALLVVARHDQHDRRLAQPMSSRNPGCEHVGRPGPPAHTEPRSNESRLNSKARHGLARNLAK